MNQRAIDSPKYELRNVRSASAFLGDGASNEFREACSRVNIQPTVRQVRKWRRRTGLAWKAGRPA
jgi:hypothetical protein